MRGAVCSGGVMTVDRLFFPAVAAVGAVAQAAVEAAFRAAAATLVVAAPRVTGENGC
jgi:hypothetical protein